MRRLRTSFPDNGFEAWGGYMQAKIAKLEDQFSSRAKCEEYQESNIFNGISVYVNGYTNPSADEIKTLMARHGGIYNTYQRSDDFVIASNLPDTKVKKLTSENVVKPEWIIESITANRLLDYRDFLLFNKCTKTQPKLCFNKLNEKNELPSSNLRPDVSQSVSEQNSCDKNTNSKILKINSNALMIPSINDEIKCTDYSHKHEVLDNKSPSAIPVTSETSPNNVGLPHSSISTKTEINTRTAVDPKFLSEFYSNSRLHHISQLGAQFKQYINELRQANDFQFPARAQLLSYHGIIVSKTAVDYREKDFEGGKVIMHIDMDCFFVSVGLRDRPELRGRPVAVTHARTSQQHQKRAGVDIETEFNLYRQKRTKALTKSTGIIKRTSQNHDELPSFVDKITVEDVKYGSLSEIASCSYEARSKGIKNGMFMGAAVKLCPDLLTIPYDFEGYKEVAYTLYNTVAQYTLDIEAVSCDEMYVDCSELIKTTNMSVQEFATALRHEIRAKTGCPCSAGFGGNRLQARLATKHAKPDGQFFLTADLVHDFMTDTKLSDLPGVGRQTSQRLEALGHQTCGSLQTVPLPTLQRLLGHKTGALLYHYCRGRDDNPLNFHIIRKSVSAEVNYGIRFENQEQCDTFLKQLSAEVQDRMQQFKVKAKGITLKLMIRAENAPVETAKFMGHGFCDIVNKSVTLATSIDDVETIIKEVLTLYKKLKINPKDLRGIGIQMSKLEEVNKQKGLLSKYVCYKHKNKSNETKLSTNNQLINDKESKEAVVIKETNNRFETPVNASDKKNLLSNNQLIHVDNSNMPKKFMNISPLKCRSPILGAMKSPEGKRRRGRPSKNRGINAPKTSTSNNVMDKFLQGVHTHRTNNYALYNIDQEILLALPEDILHEVLEHYDKHGGTAETLKSEDHVNTDNPQPPESMKLGNEVPLQEDKKNSINDLSVVSWESMRNMVRKWVTETQPQRRDAELFADYAQRMVVDRRLDKLNILMKFLKRKIEEMGCSKWKVMYDHIEEAVQSTMLTVYGKKLLI